MLTYERSRYTEKRAAYDRLSEQENKRMNKKKKRDNEKTEKIMKKKDSESL